MFIIVKQKFLKNLSVVNFRMSSLKLAYSDHSIEQTKFYNELFEKQELTDVTLACDDGFQIKVHRTTISASSLFFREVIMNSDNTNPFIYLKGVNQESLQSLLEFIYAGETVVKTENVDDLVAIGNELKILGIMEMEVNDGKSQTEGKLEDRNPKPAKQSKKSKGREQSPLPQKEGFPLPALPTAQQVCEQWDLNDVDLKYTDMDFQNLTTFKLFQQTYRPQLQAENPKVPLSKLVMLVAAKWREFGILGKGEEAEVPVEETRHF